MFVIITRTSSFCDEDIKPISEARKVKEKDPDTGISHVYWEMEINTIEDIMNLVSKYGDIIIKKDTSSNVHDVEIEIYDGYRE